MKYLSTSGVLKLARPAPRFSESGRSVRPPPASPRQVPMTRQTAYAWPDFLESPDPKRKPTAPTSNSDHPANSPTPRLKNWHILRMIRCCPGAPDNSPRPSTSRRSAKLKQDEKDSVMPVPALQVGTARAHRTALVAAWPGIPGESPGTPPCQPRLLALDILDIENSDQVV
jgi:hypothetical protein